MDGQRFDQMARILAGGVSRRAVLRGAAAVWHLAGGALVVAGVWLAAREPAPAMAVATNRTTFADRGDGGRCARHRRGRG